MEDDALTYSGVRIDWPDATDGLAGFSRGLDYSVGHLILKKGAQTKIGTESPSADSIFVMPGQLLPIPESPNRRITTIHQQRFRIQRVEPQNTNVIPGILGHLESLRATVIV